MDASTHCKISKCKVMQDLSSKQHFVGCDVSKDTLDLALYQGKTSYRNFEHIRVSNDATGYATFIKWLRSKQITVSDAVIGMEHTGFYSVAFSEWLTKKNISFCMLHPTDVKNACTRGRNKTDMIDSQFIADYLYTMREKLSPSAPEPSVIKKLRELRSERTLAVKTRTAYMNQMKTKCDSHTIKRMEKMVEMMTKEIRQIESDIKALIQSDKKLHVNFKLLMSIHGIGLVNAVTVIVTTSNFTRFKTARQYAKFCCVSPLSNQSGTSVRGGNHVGKAAHNELKSILSEAARSAIAHDSQLSEYYNRKRAAGKTHGCVMNAIKFKLVCRMFAVISRQTPYVEIDKYKS